MKSKILCWLMGLFSVIALLVYFNNISDYSFFDRIKNTCNGLIGYDWLSSTKDVINDFKNITSGYSSATYFMDYAQITIELIYNFLKMPFALSIDVIQSLATIIKFIYSILGLS